MKIPSDIAVFGDTTQRGKCPPESAEQATFFNEIRKLYPATYGRIALHPRNEGKRTLYQVSKEKAEGMTTGASDIIIGNFACELKRQDHTKSTISKEQLEFLRAFKECGGYACIALGYKAALDAFRTYIYSLTSKHF